MADQDPTLPSSAIDYGNSVFTDRNAFYNYDRTTPAQEKETVVKQNPPFIFPGNTYRDISGNTQIMRRGFMRSILFDDKIFKKYYNAARIGEGNENSSAKYVGVNGFTGSAPGNRKLNFQFNPDYLERSVSQSVGSMNPLLQSPAQLRQSVPGTAKFGFSMTFNREMEVAAGGFKRKQLQYDYNLFQEDYTNFSKNPDPEVLGVLADLMVFDTIIGQGISPDIVEAISLFTESAVKNQRAYEQEQLDAYKEKNPDGTDVPEVSTADFNVDTLLNNVNFGNSAFLNPLPVRIVFSDYFMVEGIVTASNVGFQKFSKDLIPTVCQVNVSIDALYIGFAQRNAYLTKQLEESAGQAQIQATKDTAEIEAVKQKLNAKIGKIITFYDMSVSTANGPKGDVVGPISQDSNSLSKIPGSSSTLWNYQWAAATKYTGYSNDVPLEMWYNHRLLYSTYNDDTVKYNWNFSIPISGIFLFANPIDIGIPNFDDKNIKVTASNAKIYAVYAALNKPKKTYTIDGTIVETLGGVKGKVVGITDQTTLNPSTQQTPIPTYTNPIYTWGYGYNYTVTFDRNSKLLPDGGFIKPSFMANSSTETLVEIGFSVDFTFSVDIVTKATGTPVTVTSNVKKITKSGVWGTPFFYTDLETDYYGTDKIITPNTPRGQYT